MLNTWRATQWIAHKMRQTSLGGERLASFGSGPSHNRSCPRGNYYPKSMQNFSGLKLFSQIIFKQQDLPCGVCRFFSPDTKKRPDVIGAAQAEAQLL